MSTRDRPQHVSQTSSQINDRGNARGSNGPVISGSSSDKRGRGGLGPNRKLKSRSSPKHLLYQVLLSPIKKKVTHHKQELMVSSTLEVKCFAFLLII